MSRGTGSGLSQAESHLVASGLLGPVELDEALARQLIFGGDLSTSVLEISSVSEAELEQVLARAENLPIAGPRPYKISRELSERLAARSIPALAVLPESQDRAPHLLVTARLSEAELQAATEILGFKPDAELCLEIRFLEAEARALGRPLEPRLTRLLDKLGRAGVELAESSPAEKPVALDPTPARLGPDSLRKLSRTTAPPPGGYEDFSLRAGALPEADELPFPSTQADSRARALREAIEKAPSRDALLRATLELCLEAFPFAASFAVTRGELRGLLAQARSEPARDIHSLEVPLDLRSSLSRAVREAHPTIFRPKVLGIEGGVLEDLGRAHGCDVALVPVLVRKRVVILLWLELDANEKSAPDSLQLSSLVEPVSEALRRLVLEKRELSRLASLAPKRSSIPPAAPPLAEAPLPPSLPNLAPQVGPVLTESAPPESPIEQPPPARRFSAAADLLPASEKEGLEEIVRTSIAAIPPVPSFAIPSRSSRPPTSDSGSAAPGTLKGFPKGTTRATSPEPPRFPESPQPFAAAGFAPLRPRRSIRVDENARLRGQEEAPAPDLAPSDNDAGHPVATIPGLSPAAPPIGLPPSAGPVETIPGLSPNDAPRLSARTMVSRAPLFSSDEFGAERDDPEEFDAPPMIPSLRPSQLPPPDEYTSWLKDLEAGDESVLDRFVDGGEAAVAALMNAFPGRVTEPRTSSARASECGAIPRVLVHLGRRSVPFLSIRSRDEDAVVRRWATLTLGEIPCKDAAEVIATRLFDRVPDVRRAALASARRMNVDPMARRALRSSVEAAAVDTTLDGDARAGAIEALVDIREYESIPALLSLLEDNDKSVKRAAKWALTVLMRQDFGTDIQAWRAFWNEHRDEDRIEWLILALDHSSVDLRRAAGDELAGLTGQRFGFDPHGSASERRLSQSKYREWWAARGRSRV